MDLGAQRVGLGAFRFKFQLRRCQEVQELRQHGQVRNDALQLMADADGGALHETRHRFAGVGKVILCNR